MSHTSYESTAEPMSHVPHTHEPRSHVHVKGSCPTHEWVLRK